MQPPHEPSLQQRYAPRSRCFGCGPANEHGLRIQSFVVGNQVVARFQPAPHHQAFPGVLNGGIIGSLLDCHSNWAAAYHLMQQAEQDHPDCTVTAEYNVKLRAPAPLDATLELNAHVVEASTDRATIAATLHIADKVYASCRGIFVRVQPGHPAHHRW